MILPRCPAKPLSPGLKVSAGRTSIRFGELPELDLSAAEQLVEHSQVRTIAEALQHLSATAIDGQTPVAALLSRLADELARPGVGLDAFRDARRLALRAVAVAPCR